MTDRRRREVLRLAAVLLLSPLLVAGRAANDSGQAQPLRFWLDEYAFSEGETTILREIIDEAGPEVAHVAGETKPGFLSLKGFYVPEQWDIYWTGRQGCLRVLPHALPGHKVSCVPGLHELTLKDRLVARLTYFYGEGAFDLIPRSYLLPAQYWQWRLWLAARRLEARGDMWVLKEERHRGKGVHVLPLARAVQAAKVRRPGGGNFDLAQAYVANQMTVAGRKFYVRLWAVVTSSFPLRAYLFDGGVVIFGNATPDKPTNGGGGGESDDLIVNLWSLGRTTEAAPWSIAEFCSHLDNLTGSRATFDALWRSMQRALGLAFAAGAPAMRYSAAAFPAAAAGATFEVVGVDFLVDERMKPWLLEVNAIPSLARQVLNCEQQPGGCQAGRKAASVFDSEKERFVRSLFRLLQATAGTGVTPGEGTASTGLTLAEFLARWSTNATDLAALNQSQQGAAATVQSDLGWQPAAQVPGGGAGRDLSNSGRELKSKATAPPPREAAPSAQEPAPQPPSLPAQQAPPHITRATSVAAASGLHTFVPEEHRTVVRLREHSLAAESAELEDHLMAESRAEVATALASSFLPLMMVPEAAAFSAAHQTRGTIFPQPRPAGEGEAGGGVWHALLLPFRPVVAAYGGLGRTLERLRQGLVATLPEVNGEALSGIASVVPGADGLILRGYQLFGWGDRQGTVEALGLLPKHRLDQALADHVRSLSAAQAPQ